MARSETIDGVLPVDKPRGPTSHDVIQIARRSLTTRRIGHTGTLDPFASGLLLLCIGPATRIAEFITGMDKRYRAVVRLGVRTDTDDDTGRILEQRDALQVQQSAVEEALAGLRGTIDQVPPQYSAKKVAGERAYRIAREGGVAELPAVQVTVHSIAVVRFAAPELELEIHCSSGTYIRSVARDLGEVLRVGAHLTALRRTAIGPHTVEHAITLDTLADDAAAARRKVMPPLSALTNLPRVDVNEQDVQHIRHGRAIRGDVHVSGTVAVVAGDRLVALAQAREGVLQPRKVFL